MPTRRPFAPDDTQALRRQTRFLEEVDMAIRAANREILSERMPSLDREGFFKLAVAVARLRADYLESVVHIDWHSPAETEFKDVARRREMYEEARAGFDALRHAIEMGYLEIVRAGEATDLPPGIAGGRPGPTEGGA